MALRPRICRLLTAGATLVVALAAAGPAGAAGDRPALDWHACGDGWQCATFVVPRDYDHPDGRTFKLAVTRLPAQDQAHRIGALFVNFGGPGGPAVAPLHAAGRTLFGAVNDRFDIVGFDPRGAGETRPSIDCRANQERLGIYSQPFTTPENLDVAALVAKARRYIQRCRDLNHGVLPFVSTANVARDMDAIRAAMGDARLNYFGFSYGTFLGATYVSMFPGHYRAIVLDGPLDADAYINRPLDALREQTAGFERAFGRFMMTCAARQDVCQFGGDDPWAAYDQLVADAYTMPLPSHGDDARPVGGDDILAGTALALYAKQFWGYLAVSLQLAARGDGSGFRALADAFYGRNPDGTYDPGLDRYFTIGAIEQRYPAKLQTYLEGGDDSWKLSDHFWWNNGYVELNYGLYPVRPHGVFYGPFSAAASSPTVLVVDTTYDPATPYRGGKRLVDELGNARLLTMIGDGHTAYYGNSPCIDRHVIDMIETLSLPGPGTTCRQQVPFTLPSGAPGMAPSQVTVPLRPHVAPLAGLRG